MEDKNQYINLKNSIDPPSNKQSRNYLILAPNEFRSNYDNKYKQTSAYAIDSYAVKKPLKINL